MATAGTLIAALQSLDPAVPVGALRVERRGEMTAFDLGDVVEVHVESDPVSGRPRAAWVVVGSPTSSRSEVLLEAVPSTWAVSRADCGCVMPVPVRPGRTVATLAVPCAHYQPSRIVRRWAELQETNH